MRKAGIIPERKTTKKPEYRLGATLLLDETTLHAARFSRADIDIYNDEPQKKRGDAIARRKKEYRRAAFEGSETRQARRARLAALTYEDSETENFDELTRIGSGTGNTRINPYDSETEQYFGKHRAADERTEFAAKRSGRQTRSSMDSDNILNFPSMMPETNTRLSRNAQDCDSQHDGWDSGEFERPASQSAVWTYDDYAADEALYDSRVKRREAEAARAAETEYTSRRKRAKQALHMQVKAADLSEERTKAYEPLSRMERKRAQQLAREEQLLSRRQAMLEKRSADSGKTLFPARKDDFNGSPRRALIIAGTGLALTITILALLMFSDEKPKFSGMQAPTSSPTATATATLEPQAERTPLAGVPVLPTPTLDVTSQASPTPSMTATPTPQPTATQTPQPTVTPKPTVTPQPTATPTAAPTPMPTPQPTAPPTPEPTVPPTPEPTAPPTPEPTAPPTPEPTVPPTPEPTVPPTPDPTE
ncbi:MAG: hypothetical protein ACM3S4_05560 [Burkholderiales bacterium]